MRPEEKMLSIRSGMVFANASELRTWLGYDKNVRNSFVLNTLSHYCQFVKNDDGSIVLGEIFKDIIPFRGIDFYWNIGDIVKTKHGQVLIKNRYKKVWDNEKDKHNRKTYLCECLYDGNIFEIRESHLKQGHGCCLCVKAHPLERYDSVYCTRKDLLQYFDDVNDAKYVTPFSGKRVKFRCPLCGALKEMIVSNLTKHGFCCSVCSDGLSYPNKFVRSMLSQLNLEFYPEKSFIWSDGKIYDEFIPEFNMIIENHGEQHYCEVNKFYRSLDDEIQNDIYKKNLALENGISLYFELDCRESNCEYIKNSIIQSNILNTLGVTENDIDWAQCDLWASKTIVKEICDMWDTYHNVTQIAEIYNMDIHIVSEYLVRGSKFGWCDFVKGNRSQQAWIAREIHAKPIYCIDLNIYFKDRFVCEDYFISHGYQKFDGRSLYSKINKNIRYKDLLFTYITKFEFNNKKKMFENEDVNFFVYGDYYNERYVKQDGKV